MPAGTHLWMISEHYDKGSRSDLRMSEMSLSVADEDNLSDWERKEGGKRIKHYDSQIVRKRPQELCRLVFRNLEDNGHVCVCSAKCK